jgi:hypothetical protein
MHSISHICTRCGVDLARVRPTIDPQYALPLVTCPRCAQVAVRRHHPLPLTARRAWRAAWAVVALLVQMSLVVLITVLSLERIHRLAEFVERSLGGLRLHREDAVGLAVFAGIGVVVGVWLTAGLSHWRRASAFVGWGLWLVVWIWIIHVFLAIGAAIDAVAGSRFWRFIDFEAIALHSEAVVPLLSVAFLGVPIGLAARRTVAHVRSERWRSRRAKRRAAQAGLA